MGGLPINDCFYDDYLRYEKIKLYFGGYGSGKSIFIVQDLIAKCRKEEYFKCYYGRKVFDTVRGSCFETIVETIEDLGLQEEFSYSKAPTSTMMIVHRVTGNKFVPFGSDKPDKLKSIKDPTHIWCEEFDQFQDADSATGRKGDFQLLFPRLRTTKAKTQFIASFNTDPVYPTHWILKYFFPDLYEGDDKAEFDLLDGIEITKTFANYTDNYFIDKEAYYQSLVLASGGSSLVLDAIAKGAWGVLLNKDPWLYAFDKSKHVRDNIVFLPTFPIYVFIDVNNDPLECTIWQISPQKGTKNSFIHCIDEFSGKYKVMELGAQIKSKYPSSIIYLGGDRSGQNEDVGRNQTIYQILGGAMGLSNKQLLLNTHNLEHADSRLLCNAMMHNYPNFYISSKCTNLIRQMQIAKVDNNSSTPSKLLKDRGMYKLDMFDSYRYMLQTLFNDFAKNTYFRARKG